MTLCVAAFATIFPDQGPHETSVHFCADLRIETLSAGSEVAYKFRKVADGWAAMFAGNVSRALQLLNLYSLHFKGRDIPKEGVIDELRIPPQQFKRKLVGEYVSSVTGLSFDQFTADGQKILPASLFERIWEDVTRIDLGCQLILIPIVTRDHFYLVGSDGAVSSHPHFCVIGSGSDNADSWLHFRQQNRFESPDLTTLHLLEAKRFAEIAPGGGKKTSLAILSHESKLHQWTDDVVAKLEENVWKKFGPRETPWGTCLTLPDSNPVIWDDLGVG